MAAVSVSNEALAAYTPLCHYLGKRYDTLHGAEYDDLFQEGWLSCFLALRIGGRPSQDVVAKVMLRWVNKCAQHGVSRDQDSYIEDEDVHV